MPRKRKPAASPRPNSVTLEAWKVVICACEWRANLIGPESRLLAADTELARAVDEFRAAQRGTAK